ncbi:hypothetical protein C0Q99_31350 [Streptomyces albidoflavus]|nr:hypothetical protein [Streptomyces sp. McG6]MBT2885777.1 hypothetical protein [Streptomyces sp. McG5]MBT2889210.1 hypothetical protein [Streptomyces sp. McG2]MBV7251526.1 hypothetical protein [Streptomyces sp. S-2]RZE68165.1 hypothetical protein C0Q99_31350 [Streptomyces albidoflavus]
MELVNQVVAVGSLDWSKHEEDFRLLAVNVSLRRQIESMRAATVLARQGLGHLAVSFVRPALEEVLYLGFFASLTREESQELFSALGVWDSTRSLLAQRAHVGDEVMRSLWYPPGFLDSVETKRAETADALKDLRGRHRWSGGRVPSAAWIAEMSGKKKLYDYLHAATSRSLHFSAGEVMRQGWGHPAGKVVTDKREFREHLASFALDQLWRLHVECWGVTAPFWEDAGVGGDETINFEDTEPLLNRLIELGKVPLVHAHEWNLRPPNRRPHQGNSSG